MTEIETELKQIISKFFRVEIEEISGWEKLNPSTNYVYKFCVGGKKYVVRKPKWPDASVIKKEKAAYKAIKDLHVSDEVLKIYANGIKISKYIEGGKNLTLSKKDKKDAIDLLRNIHQSGVKIDTSYSVWGEADNGLAAISVWAEYCDSKHITNKKELQMFKSDIERIETVLEQMNVAPVLCHGDACGISNFLQLKDGTIRLIDWEQAGMADPFFDFAKMAINQTEHKDMHDVDPQWCIEYYLMRKLNANELYRLYAYITLVSFLVAAYEINNDDGFKWYLEIAIRSLAEAKEHDHS